MTWSFTHCFKSVESFFALQKKKRKNWLLLGFSFLINYWHVGGVEIGLGWP